MLGQQQQPAAAAAAAAMTARRDGRYVAGPAGLHVVCWQVLSGVTCVGGGSEGRRGIKRPLAVVQGNGGRVAAVGGGSGDSRKFSNLLTVMAVPAPQTFDVRVRVVGHYPPEVGVGCMKRQRQMLAVVAGL